MIKIQIYIPGNPCAKGRPRFARRGKFVSTYSPPKTANNALACKNKAMLQMGDRKPLEGAISCRVCYFMPIPKSVSKKNTIKMLSGEIQHVKKPDVDNLAKQTLDFLNGIAFVDDSQIVKLIIEKCYSDYPRTEIYLQEVCN